MKEDTENLNRLEKIKGRIELLGSLPTPLIPRQIMDDLRWMEERLRPHLTREANQQKFTWLEKGKWNVTGSSANPFEHFENLKGCNGGNENLDAWRKILKEKWEEDDRKP